VRWWVLSDFKDPADRTNSASITIRGQKDICLVIGNGASPCAGCRDDAEVCDRESGMESGVYLQSLMYLGSDTARFDRV
jgi:hypothetical protein